MRQEISIFVASKRSLEELAARTEQILDIKFKPEDVERFHQNSEYTAYIFRDESLKKGLKILRPHPDYTLLDDGDKLFSRYNYEITLYSWGEDDWEAVEKNTRAFADSIFEKLKATNQYSLMMVEGVEIKLDQFEPIQPS